MAASISGPSVAGGDKANILLVDDQPGKLLSYEAMLSGLGETLIPARSAREALGHLLSTDVAVVLIDVCMPELDGFDLAAMMREHPRFQQTPIIFVSGVHLTELDRLKGYACGAVDYVPVPVVPEILRAKVSVFVDLFRKTRELERLNRELEQRVVERTAELQAVAAELRNREEALREADRSKDEFLAVLAHEIRNPLAPIRTAVHLLRLKELPDTQRSKARDVIDRQVEHLVRLIDDLLDVSRITRGTITLKREPVELADVIARAVEANRPLIDSRRLELVVGLPEGPLRVDADLTRLGQVLGNLLNNAAKYTEPGGHVSVSAEREGDDAVIRVRDDGVGIPPHMLHKVFDLFAQVDHGLDRQTGGLGIGLALVRRLVALHGGQVRAYSEGLGLGTEMVVRLPIRDDDRRATVQPAADQEVAATVIRPRRVLIVDDNRDAADSMALALQLAGHAVTTAYNGTEGIERASVFGPEVVLLDLGMPGLNGFEMARRIRQQPWGATLALVALTGWGQERDRRRTKEAGFDAHLTKPVSASELLKALEAVMADGNRPRPSQM